MNWSIFQDGFLTPLLNAPSSFMCCIATAAASKRFHKKTDEPYYCLGSLLLLAIPDPLSSQISFLSYQPFLNQIDLYLQFFFLSHFSKHLLKYVVCRAYKFDFFLYAFAQNEIKINKITNSHGQKLVDLLTNNDDNSVSLYVFSKPDHLKKN